MSKPIATPDLLSKIYRLVWNKTDQSNLSYYTKDDREPPTVDEFRLFSKVGVDCAGFAFEFANQIREELAGFILTFVHTNSHGAVVVRLDKGDHTMIADSSARCILNLPSNHGEEIESPHDPAIKWSVNAEGDARNSLKWVKMTAVTENEFVAKTAKHHQKSPSGYMLWRGEMKENEFGRFLPRGYTTVGKGEVQIRFTESPKGRVVGRLEDSDKIIKRSIKRAYANLDSLSAPPRRER